MIPVNAPTLGGREREYVLDCLDTVWISSAGQYVGRFEEGFATYCGARHGITTTNGTTALHLALAALDIGPGDEVILPALTIAACAFAVAYTGAVPVCVDSEPLTGNMDPALIEGRITPRTRAIMPVHLYGHPVDMDPVVDIARRHSLYVIEDAAEAHGATYKGRRVGGIGTVGCFSFYANKLLTTGEGGMVVTSDATVADHARRLKDLAHSPQRRFMHEEIGFNYRLTNVQAAIGLAQLEQMDASVSKKRWMAARYAEELAGLRGLHLPYEAPWAQSVFWMYAVRVDKEATLACGPLTRALRERGIDTRPFFVPMNLQPVFQKRGWFVGERYPVAEELAETGFYLPSGLAITDEQISTVGAAMRDLLGE